jgi:hypothetical protein
MVSESLPQLPGAAGIAGPPWGQSDNTVSGGIDRAEKINKKPLPPLKRKKKVVETDTTPVLPAKGSANRVRCNFYFLFLYLCSFWCTIQNKRAKHHHKGDSPTFSPYQTPTLLKTGIRTRTPTHANVVLAFSFQSDRWRASWAAP